jgi:hypothetical protein
VCPIPIPSLPGTQLNRRKWPPLIPALTICQAAELHPHHGHAQSLAVLLDGRFL